MSCDNDDSLVLALISPTPSSFLLFLSWTAFALSASAPGTLSLPLAISAPFLS